MYQAATTVISSFFNGKVVIVTGSSVGIGRETARKFAENGAKVTITGRNIAALQETEKFCIRSGSKKGDIHIVVGDLNLKETQESIIKETIENFGKLDVLVNNAGAMIPNMEGKRGIDIPDEELRAVMDNNLFTCSSDNGQSRLPNCSMVSLTRLAVPHLETTKGAIVNVSSIAAQPHLSKDFYYNISKAAVDQLTTQLAGNLILKGIRVNSVNPGATSTEFVTRHAGEEVKQQLKAAWETPDIIPIGRMGKVEDIAKVILFLADRSQSEFIIGQHIIVDGGSSLLNNLMCAISVF
ncbi:hypothetical protein PRIPAC_78830 [Pristionchus pacificus]|uniref:Dehydrogenase n=1 Tax=Pristionchus pacificus TaxID=54126 RepID=A0A2A6C391_PRIPA|nr:hypothetical protein PRIPAC_78830 [Pristionchus pacificus]|eukprot:PDM72702.1 dehydrogenase [Pristionchus pacificus]